MHPTLRDILLFSSGFAVLMWQNFYADDVSPILVATAVSMMIGAPTIYRVLDKADKKLNDKNGTPPKENGQ